MHYICIKDIVMFWRMPFIIRIVISLELGAKELRENKPFSSISRRYQNAYENQRQFPFSLINSFCFPNQKWEDIKSSQTAR